MIQEALEKLNKALNEKKKSEMQKFLEANKEVLYELGYCKESEVCEVYDRQLNEVFSRLKQDAECHKLDVSDIVDFAEEYGVKLSAE